MNYTIITLGIAFGMASVIHDIRYECDACFKSALAGII